MLQRLCRLDRSAAQWRDLRFSVSGSRRWPSGLQPRRPCCGAERFGRDARFVRRLTFVSWGSWRTCYNDFVVSTGAQRRGEICGFPFRVLALLGGGQTGCGHGDHAAARSASVEMPNSSDDRLSFPGEAGARATTTLSSRPERSAVERSAVFPFALLGGGQTGCGHGDHAAARSASVEMPNSSDDRLSFPGEAGARATTTLSSRPECSAVERSAVFPFALLGGGQTGCGHGDHAAARSASVETTASSDDRLSFPGEAGARATTTLSSRPERSAVERSAVFPFGF